MTTALKTNAGLAHFGADPHPHSRAVTPAMTTALKTNAGLVHLAADPHPLPHSRVVVQL